MSEKMGMVIYRYNEQEDLEVLLVNQRSGEGAYRLPQCAFGNCDEFEQSTGISTHYNEEVIALEMKEASGLRETALALESKVEEKITKFMRIRKEEGNYVALKEAFKKILPHEYSMLKELKEILIERNSMKSI